MKGARSESRPSKPLLEWIAAAVGAVLVVGSLGYMTYQAVAGDHSQPDLVAEADTIERVAGGWLVRIHVRNRGGETVASLRVVAELRDGERIVETSDVVFDYIAANSVRSGGVFFRDDPRRHELVLRPAGYEKP